MLLHILAPVFCLVKISVQLLILCNVPLTLTLYMRMQSVIEKNRDLK